MQQQRARARNKQKADVDVEEGGRGAAAALITHRTSSDRQRPCEFIKPCELVTESSSLKTSAAGPVLKKRAGASQYCTCDGALTCDYCLQFEL